MKRNLEARTADAKRTPPTPVWFPAEIWAEISTHCTPSTRRSLALSCKTIASVLSQPFHKNVAMERFSKPRQFVDTDGMVHNWNELPSGARHGVHEIFFPDGTVSSRWVWKNNKKHGLDEMYYDDGGVRSRTQFVDGMKHGTQIVYHEDGKTPWRITEWAYGHRSGKEEEFFDTGERYSLLNWVAGTMCGDQVWFNKDGTVRQLKRCQLFPVQ